MSGFSFHPFPDIPHRPETRVAAATSDLDVLPAAFPAAIEFAFMGNKPHARTRLAGEKPVSRLATVHLADFLTPYHLERIAVRVRIAA